MKIYTLFYNGDYILLTEEQAAEYREDVIKVWEFEHDAYTADAHIQAGKLQADANLVSDKGLTDPDVLMTARGKAIAQIILKSWNRKTDDGAEVPISPATIGSLPPRVLRRFAEKILAPVIPSAEELEAMKKKPTTSTAAI